VDVVVDFMRDFVAAEHGALMSMYTERDDTAFAAKRAKLDTFYAPDVPSDLKAPATRDAAFFKQSAAALDTVQPRVLFQIQHYRHPKVGNLYRVYVSDKIRAGKTADYFANLYVAEKKGKLQIIAKYLICLECEGTGKADGKKCAECKGKGWEHFEGTKIPNPGELVEVRKLHKPDNPQQLVEYEAE